MIPVPFLDSESYQSIRKELRADQSFVHPPERKLNNGSVSPEISQESDKQVFRVAKETKPITDRAWSFLRHRMLFAGCCQDGRLTDSELNGSAPCESLGLLVLNC